MPKKLTTEEFVKRSIEVQNELYDYSKTIYQGNLINVVIICPTHGEFKQLPKNHLKGAKCNFCANISRSQSGNKNRTFNTELFIDKAIEKHGIKYDYSLVDYSLSKNNIEIICPIHGEFNQRPSEHLSGAGCKKCSDESKRIDTQTFIKDSNNIHNNKYTYSSTTYSSCYEKIIITCPIHGDFKQKAYAHKSGQGCPSCSDSHGEKEIKKFLTEHKINFISQYKFDDCKNKRHLPFDFYLPEINLCIEFDGLQHFKSAGYDKDGSALKRTQFNDNIKNKYCSQKGIRLLRIKFDDNIINRLESTLRNK